MQYLTKDAFSQAIRDGESMGIPKATTYKSLKQKGYTIEGEPKDSLSPEKSGGVFNYFTDVLKNGAREVGAVVKFGGQVLTDPSKGLEFGRDAFKGAATLAVGAGENIYEKVTGNQVPIFNPDGTTTYPEKSIYEDPIRGGTPEQRVASGLGKNLIESVYSPSGGVFEGKGFTLPETFKKHPLSTLSVAAPLASGVLGRTSTLAKTGAMVEKGRGLAGAAEAAGMAKTAKALSTAGKVSAAVDPMNAAVNVVTKGPGAVAKYGKGLLGAATGAGDESIKIAAQAHGADSAFYQGMRGDVLEQGRILANDSRKAIAALKTQRSKQYLQTKEALTNIMEPLSGEPIYSKLSKTMKEFGITNAEKEILDTMIGMSDDQATAALNSMLKIGDGKLSPLVKAGIGEGPTASKISKAINYVENWDDFTPASLDNLQQALTTIGAKPGTREFVFIDKLKKGVQAVVKDKYPEYTKLLSDYSDASNFIDEIEGAIGAGSKADVEKVVLKMSQTMKTGNMRFEIKNSLVKQLEELTGLPLRERIAGMSLAEYYPRGLAKVGAGMGTAGAVGFGGLSVFTAPSFWMAVGMSSPRVVGEILGAIGVAKSYIPTIVDRLKKVMPFDDVLRSDNAVRALSLSDDADDLPLSTFSPQGVKDAAKMDDLVKGGMTPQEAAKSLNDPLTLPRNGAGDQQLARMAYKNTVKNGGTTISLQGNAPKEGYAYSVMKEQTTVPTIQETMNDHARFIKQNYEALKDPNNHIGVWRNPEDGLTYFDISRVSPRSSEAIKTAHDAQQLAVYDLGAGKEISIGKMENAVYSKLDEATRIHDNWLQAERGAQNSRGIGDGVVASNAEVRPNVQAGGSKLINVKPTATNIFVKDQKELLKGLSSEQKGAFITARNKSLSDRPEFLAGTEAVTNKTGVKNVGIDFKSDGRMLEKASNSLREGMNIKFSDLLDMNRDGYSAKSAKQMDQLFDAIKEKFEIVRVKDRITKPVDGYRDILINVKLANGTIGELQIQPSNISVLKNTEHVQYEIARKIVEKAPKNSKGELILGTVDKAKLQAATDSMSVKYGQAWSDYLRGNPNFMQEYSGLAKRLKTYSEKLNQARP